MKTKVQELYEEWCGEDRHANDCHPVHDSSETIEFAEYYYNELTKWIPVEEAFPCDEQEIICKNDVYKEVHTFYKNGIFNENELKLHFTHWRQIEYK